MNKTDPLVFGFVNDNKVFRVLVEKCYLFFWLAPNGGRGQHCLNKHPA